MSAFNNINIPDIDTDKLANKDYAKMIANYLLDLDDQLRYMFGNLEEENFTDKYIENLTARKVIVTNGDNSITADPNDGLIMSKGAKKQFSFDINTGDLEFGGKMIGGSIQSANYVLNTSGMLLDLDAGTWDSVGFKYNGTSCDIKGKLTSTGTYGGSAHTVTLENGVVFADYLMLGTGVNSAIMQPTIASFTNASYNLQITAAGITRYTADLMSSVAFLTSGNYGTYITGATGTFTSANGKTITVSNGRITSIV